MGWCSATEIMDAATTAVDKVVAELSGPAAGEPEILAASDDLIRPFVRAIAEKLRSEDWDCIEEADAFDRFRQEMLGYDDHKMAHWYRTQLQEQDDPDLLREYAKCLAKLMEAN